MEPDPQKVFVDTNIWFSAFYGSDNSEKILRAHIEGKIRAVISQQVLEELVKNIKDKMPQAREVLQRLLESAPPQIVMTPTQISPEIEKWVDAKDKSIFQAAVNARVQLFVTGNIKDFSVKNLKKKFGINIIPPKSAIKKLGL